MSLLAEINITEDGTEFVRCGNTPTFESNRFSIQAYGTFGGATLQIVSSPDGSTEITDISDSATTSFTDAFARHFDFNSADGSPSYIGIKASSTSGTTDITVRVYDVFPG